MDVRNRRLKGIEVNQKIRKVCWRSISRNEIFVEIIKIEIRNVIKVLEGPR